MLGQFNKAKMDSLISDAISHYKSLAMFADSSKTSGLMSSARKNINEAELSRCRAFCPVVKKSGRFKILWGGDGRYYTPLTPELALSSIQSAVSLANSQLNEVEKLTRKLPKENGSTQLVFSTTPKEISSSFEELPTLIDRPGFTEEVSSDVTDSSPSSTSNASNIFSFIFGNNTKENTVNPEVQRIKDMIAKGELGGTLQEELAAEGISLREEIQAKPPLEQVQTLLTATPLRNNPVLLTSLDQAKKVADIILGNFDSVEKQRLAEKLFAESKMGGPVYLPPIAAQVIEEKTFNWPIFLFGAMVFLGISYFTYKSGRKRRKKPGVIKVDAEIIRPSMSSVKLLPAPR